MSNQYITVENQTILWKTIQRSPQFVNNTIAINREQWFSGIIKKFYENIKSPKMSIAELKALNQQTIAYMLSDLKNIESQQTVSPSALRLSSSPQHTSIAQFGYETPQTRMSMYNEQFNNRQQEYTNMVKPHAPPTANFSEKVEDEAITNMDELLQQQIKQREYDVATIRPPQPPAMNNNESPPTYTSNNHTANITTKDNAQTNDVMTIIQEFAKQLAELKDEIRVLKENMAVPQLTKDPPFELHGVEM